MRRRFVQCDVFSSVPTLGNGLAVVVDADGLSGERMQAFAAWTNLAETTFLLPPEHPHADYRVRIFTPAREMPFAGHPTLGSCEAWLRSGGVPADPARIVQECAVGLVEIDRTGVVPAFIAPPTRVAPMPDETLDRLLSALNIPRDRVLAAATLDNGPTWQALELVGAADVLDIDSSRVRWPAVKPVGVFGGHPVGSECDYEVRLLAPSSGMSEDPVTGSFAAALGHWLLAQGRLARPLVAAQGMSIGRAGRIHMAPAPEGVRIGGHTELIIEGHVEL